MRKFFVVLLTLLLVVQIGTVSAAAANETTYTIRVFSGNRGDILPGYNGGQVLDGGAVWVLSGLKYGTQVTFDPDAPGAVKVTNDRYYVQGIRFSGRDNNALQNTTITVREDADYVVAYGVKGNLVPYVVNYQDANGNALAASKTYYGNVGDKPVVAFLYIDGYVPQAYNLTKTLTGNAAKDVLTFTYTPLVTVQPEEEVVDNGETVIPGGDGGDGGAGGAAGAGADANAADGQNVDDNANTEPVTVNLQDEETPLSNGPQEIVDLDDMDTPLAEFEGMDTARSTNNGGNFAWAMTTLSGAAVGLFVLLLVLFPFLKRRKAEKEEAQGA